MNYHICCHHSSQTLIEFLLVRFAAEGNGIVSNEAGGPRFRFLLQIKRKLEGSLIRVKIVYLFIYFHAMLVPKKTIGICLR